MCKCPVCGKARQVKKVNNLHRFQSQLEGSGLVTRMEILLLPSEESGLSSWGGGNPPLLDSIVQSRGVSGEDKG